METERGFTVAEMLAALIILSLGMVAAGDVIFQQQRAWSKISDQQTSAEGLAALYPRILDWQSKRPTYPQASGAPALQTDNGAPFPLSGSRIQKNADCLYDPEERLCQ